MKHLYLFLSLLIVTLQLRSQGLNRTVAHYLANVGTGIVSGPGDEWLVTGLTATFGGEAFLSTITSSDNAWNEVFLLEENIASGEIINLSNVVYDPQSGQYFVIVAPAGCDYGVPDHLLAINTGITPYAFSYPLPDDFDLFVANYQLALTPNGEILIFPQTESAFSMLVFAEGEFAYEAIFENDLPEDLQPANSVLALSEERLVHLSEGQLTLLKRDTINATVEMGAALNISAGVVLAPSTDSTFYVATNQQLEIRNLELELVNSVSLGGNPIDVEIEDGTAFVLVASTVQYFDANLSLIGEIELDELSNREVLDLAVKDGTLGVVGATRVAYGYYSGYHWEKSPADLFVRTYDTTGPQLPSNTDLTIESISYESAVAGTPFDPDCMNLDVEGVRVRVRNNGMDEIDQLVLTGKRDACEGFICPTWVGLHWWFDNLNLGPGEFVDLPINYELYWVPTQETTDICLEVFADNATMDLNRHDNRLCESVLIVDADEVKPVESVKLYPSPATDQITLDLPTGHSYQFIHLYNSFGQEIKRRVIEPTSLSINWRIDQLASGTYFIQLIGQEGQSTQTFTKI